MNQRALFITYDGLLDPLGGSQILPYLRSIAAHPRPLYILSFEKPERYRKGAHALLSELDGRGIGWTPLTFTSKLGKLGKIWDLLRMYLVGLYLAWRHGIHLVHARGHLSAQVGWVIKRVFRAKLIFDFRGLWVDERVDKGGWDLGRLSDRIQYRHYKRIESKLLARADHVVVLTEAVVEQVIRLGVSSVSKITVIPCCADFDHFKLVTQKGRDGARRRLHIPDDALVIGYLGSIGPVYMPLQSLHFFELIAKQSNNARMVVITPDVSSLTTLVEQHLPNELHDRVVAVSASRDEVPSLLCAMDILVSFILPSPARTSTSPTKLAECFAVGIPAVCNPGIGDVKQVLEELQAGVLVDPASDSDLQALGERLIAVQSMGGRRLRDAARPLLGLELAESRYRSVYSVLG